MHHPGHVHFFAPIIRWFIAHDVEVIIEAKDIAIVRALLEQKGLSYSVRRDFRRGKSLIFACCDLLAGWWRLLGRMVSAKPDLVMSVAGVYTAFPAWIMRIQNWLFTDTETAVTQKISFPFAKRIYIPKVYCRELEHNLHLGGERVTFYPGTHEGAYLLGKRDDAKFKETAQHFAEKEGLTGPFFLMRLIGWGAFHDVAVKKDRLRALEILAEELSKHGRVMMNFEKDVPDSLKKYQYPYQPDDYFYLLFLAQAVLTEGATTATEAAYLGTPSYYVNPTVYGTLRDLRDNFRLVRTCLDFEACLEQVRKDGDLDSWKQDSREQFEKYAKSKMNIWDELFIK